MTPVEILARLINDRIDAPYFEHDIEAEPAWFPKTDSKGIQPWDAQNEGGEAQAIISVDGKAYCISLEELP